MKLTKKNDNKAPMSQTMKYVIGVVVLVVLIVIGGVAWYMESTKSERDALNGTGLEEEEWDDEGGLKVEEEGDGGTIDFDDDKKDDKNDNKNNNKNDNKNNNKNDDKNDDKKDDDKVKKEDDDDIDFGRIF